MPLVGIVYWYNSEISDTFQWPRENGMAQRGIYHILLCKCHWINNTSSTLSTMYMALSVSTSYLPFCLLTTYASWGVGQLWSQSHLLFNLSSRAWIPNLHLFSRKLKNNFLTNYSCESVVCGKGENLGNGDPLQNYQKSSQFIICRFSLPKHSCSPTDILLLIVHLCWNHSDTLY